MDGAWLKYFFIQDMLKCSAGANFSNNKDTGDSSLFYEGQDKLLQSIGLYSKCSIQTKTLIFNQIFNVQNGNFTIIHQEKEVYIDIPDGVYTYDSLLKLINKEITNKLGDWFKFVKYKVKDQYSAKFTILNNNEKNENVVLVGQSYFFFALGIVDYQTALLNKPCIVTCAPKQGIDFYMNLYKGLNVVNFIYCNQNFFTINLTPKLLSDNWSNDDENSFILLTPPSTDLSIEIVNQNNSVIKVRNIFSMNIKSKYTQLKTNVKYTIE